MIFGNVITSWLWLRADASATSPTSKPFAKPVTGSTRPTLSDGSPKRSAARPSSRTRTDGKKAPLYHRRWLVVYKQGGVWLVAHCDHAADSLAGLNDFAFPKELKTFPAFEAARRYCMVAARPWARNL